MLMSVTGLRKMVNVQMRKLTKKGVSEIIAYVLIVSLAVTLGTLVTIWYKSTTEKQVETLLNPLEGSTQCEGVNVNLAFRSDTCSVAVFNTGTTMIDSLQITYTDGSGGINTSKYELKIPPRLSQEITLPSEGVQSGNIDTINVLPIILVDNQPYFCQGNYLFRATQAFSNCPGA